MLHRLASIQLWPTPLQRSRMLCRSIVALKAQVARQGGDTPGQSRFNCAGLSAGSPLTSVSRLSRSSAVTTRTSPVCTAFSRPFRPRLCITVPVMMSSWIRTASTPAPVSAAADSAGCRSRRSCRGIRGRNHRSSLVCSRGLAGVSQTGI